MSEKPTLLFVHGAWHGAWAWDLVRELMEARGWSTVAVDLPSSAQEDQSAVTLADDAAVITRAIEEIDGPVAVIAHSYGGVPTSEGAGNAQYLIYVASFALDIGESLLAAAGGEPPSWWDVQGPLVIAGNETQTPQDIFFGDIDDEMAAAIVPRLRAQGLLSMSQPLTRAAWRDIPSTYVIAENDAAIPAFVQEQLAARIGARVERLATSHSPFLSQPEAVADIIESALGECFLGPQAVGRRYSARVDVIDVVGLGADGLASCPASGRQALAGAEVILGGRRHLDLVAGLGSAELVDWPSPLLAGLPGLLARYAGRRVVVLASGDPLVAGIGSTLIEVLGAEAVRIHPAVSSVALARARMGWPAENVEVLRLGAGRGIDGLRRVLSPGRRILVLSADERSPAEVATVCCDAGVPGARMSILGNLGAPDELRMDGDAAEFAGWGDAGEATGTGRPATIGMVPRLNIVAIECPGSTVGIGSGGGRASASERGPLDSRSEAAAWPRRAPEAENPPSHRVVRPVSGWLAPGLPDDAYEHDGQLTKRHVRAAALAALQPTPGELLWDLGAGAGSVGIEWARLHPANRVIAVERARERAERVARNAERLGVPRLEICIGSAFDLLADLPDPDAVFVGGGASAELLAACWERLPEHGRLVVHGVTLETETVLLDEHAARGGELVQLAVSIAKALGRYRGWAPARPVVQWSVTKAGS